MKKATAVFAALVLLGGSAFAQEWSAAQKEVWKNVEAYNALAMARDVEGFMAYFHPDYLGWEYSSPLPQDKTATRKWVEYNFKTSKVMVFELNPVGIKIHGNVAFVHYYYTALYKDVEGKEKGTSGRWTDILLKQGDKWFMIGDHGGQTSKN